MPYKSYYKILGLPNGASKKEVKKAFRRKAMITHPDRNPNKNAQQEFYLVNQAYEILMGEIPLPKSTRTQSNKKSSNSSSEHEETLKTERELRRKRAQETLRKRNEAYRNSPQFKLDLAIGVILDQLGYLVGLLVMIPIPFILFTGLVGVFIAILLTVLTYPFWYRAWVEKKPTLHPKHFWMAFKYVYIKTNFKYYFFGIVNGVLFLTVVLNTFVNLYYLYGLILLPIAVVLLSRRIKRFNNFETHKAIVVGVLPLIIHLFFLLNIMFSHSERIEYQRVKNPHQPDTIVLEFDNDVYKNYQGIRCLMEKRKPTEHYVVLVVAEGFFGFNVLKTYAYSSGVH